MAIQNRRGTKNNFDPNKLLAGEFAYVLDTAELFYCYSPGNVKKLLTADDVQNILNSSSEAYEALQQLLADLENDPSEITNILNNISELQANKLDKTGDTKDATVSFTQASTLSNIVSGESHTTHFGKIMKFFSFIGITALTTTAQTITGAINELVTSLSGKMSKYNLNTSTTGQVLTSNGDGTAEFIDIPQNNSFNKFVNLLVNGQVSKIKLIGDSITDGNGTRSYISPLNTNTVIFNDGAGNIFYEPNATNNGWAQKFKSFIASDFPAIQFVNAGIGGKSAKWANTNKAYWISASEDIVFVMLGTNDRWDCSTVSEFQTVLTSFLSYVYSKCNLMIVMTAPPTLNDTDTTTYHFGMKEVDRIITEVCRSNNYIHISHYRMMLDYAANTGSIDTLIEKNGTHPNDEGYKSMWKSIQQSLGFSDGVEKWKSGDISNPIIVKHGDTYPYFLSTTPITDFTPGKETIIETYSTHTDTVNFPESSTGRVKTVRGIANDLYSYQIFEPREVNSIYKRSWNYGENAWNPWVNISHDSLGTVFTTTTKLVSTVPTGVYTNVASLSLTAGTYFVTGYIRWDTSGSDQRYIQITTGNTNQVAGVQFMTNTAIITLSSTTTIYLMGQQSTGSNLALNTNGVELKAVKII